MAARWCPSIPEGAASCARLPRLAAHAGKLEGQVSMCQLPVSFLPVLFRRRLRQTADRQWHVVYGCSHTGEQCYTTACQPPRTCAHLQSPSYDTALNTIMVLPSLHVLLGHHLPPGLLLIQKRYLALVQLVHLLLHCEVLTYGT